MKLFQNILNFCAMKLINLVCRSRDEILYITHDCTTTVNLSVVLLPVWQVYTSDWPFWTYLLSCFRSNRGTLLTDHSERICCHALGLTGVHFCLTILNVSVVMLLVWQGYTSDWLFWTYLLSCSWSDSGTLLTNDHSELICCHALGRTGVHFWLTILNVSVVMLLVGQWYTSD